MNPVRAGEEFILGAAAAGLMGAPMRIANALRGGGGSQAAAIQPYTEQEAANLSSPKGVVNGKDGTFRQFIQEARSGKDSKKFYFGKLRGDVVDAIKKETLRNVEGYNLVINSDEIRHIFRQHGGEGELSRGQIPVTEDLMELIPYVFESPDRVTASPKPDYAGRTAFQVEKNIGEGYAIVMNGISDGKQSVAADTFYIKKRPPTTSDAPSSPKSPNQRPKPSSGPASGSIVAESDAGVNSEDSMGEAHKVINRMDLQPLTGADTGPEPAADVRTTGPSNTIISDPTAGVNGSMPSQGAGTQALSAGSGTAAVTQAPDTSTQKSRRYQGRVVRRLADEVAQALSLPAGARRDFIDGVNQQVVEEVRRTGRVSDATREQLFREAYARGAVVLEDYYNQYRDLKNTLRTTPLTLSLTDRADVGDYSGFRRDSFGTLRLTDQGGLPVDSFYQELSGEYPQLFPADLTHPGDQAKRLLEVGKGIARVEMDLDSYHGADAEEFRLIARHNFDEALNRFEEEMKPVFRYEADRALASSPGEGEAGPLLGVEEVDQLRQRLQAARKKSEQITGSNMLTREDNRVVDQLLAGIRDLDQIPQGMNVRGIRAAYEAKKAVADIRETLAANKKAVRARYADQADEITETQGSWKDKVNGLLYNRETAERNIRDMIPDKAVADRVIAAYFTPVHQNQAALTRRANEIRAEVNALGIGTKKRYNVELPLEGGPAQAKVSEAELVQLLGEGVISEAQVEAAGADAGKISRAVEVIRNIYDTLFREVNEVLVANGYDPIEYRKDYFPHFSPDTGSDTFMGRVRFLLGIPEGGDNLPTDIAGLTYTFRPGKRWVGNFLRRQGEQTSYNALEGMDRYLSGVLDVIYHTGDIQRLRALENSIRYKNSSDGIKEEVRRIRDSTEIPDSAKEDTINAIYDRSPSHLSNFVTWLRQYTDNLAGKKAIGDRQWEYNLGRRMYGVMNSVERRVAANMVGGNISSALTNFIPIFQSMGEVNPAYTARALRETARAARKDDGFTAASDFLTNRIGSDPLYRTGLQKATDAASAPFSLVDRISAEVVVRSKYLQNLDRGMTQTEAMEDADAFAASIMADRSKGAAPIIFNAQNPVAKAFSMFQVEVNNQLSYYFKDLPRNVGERGKAAVAGALLRTFLATWLYGTLFEKLAGYDPTLNPIGTAQDFAEDVQEGGLQQALPALAEEAASQVPFLGTFAGGGRLPVSDILPDIARVAGSAGSENFGEVLGDEALSTASLLLPPLGGNQLRKTIQGLETVREGGYYTTNKEGEEQLRFLVEQTPGNYLRGAIFGRWSFPEAREYVDSGFKPLSAAYTAKMKQGEANGITPQQFLAAYDAQRTSTWTKGEYLAKAKAQKAAIDQALPALSPSQKEFLYEAFGVSEKVW